MNKDETWYQLLPGAVVALVAYPMAILITLAITFFYASQRWRKLWIRELVGWSSYAYRDETFWFRIVEMWRFLCFAALQIVAFKHNESGGVTQALSALLVVAIGMCFLLMRPYKRYRKKLLEFVILFSHGLVLLMSSISLAPESTEITPEVKSLFKEYVFGIICATYFLIFVDVAWSVVEELPYSQRLEMNLRERFKAFVVSVYKFVNLPPPGAWATHPEFDEDIPVKSLFTPSAAAVLREMAESQPRDRWSTDDRAAFARSAHSLLRHRLINVRLGRRDAGQITSYPNLFQPQIKQQMMASASLEDTEHNRLVMTFVEKRLLRVLRMTHRKFYGRVRKKLTSEDALNPLLERWLRRDVEGFEWMDEHGEQHEKDGFLSDSLRHVSSKLYGAKPGPVTESAIELLDMSPVRIGDGDDSTENENRHGPGPVTESAKPRKSLRVGSPGTSPRNSSKGYFANLDNVSVGKRDSGKLASLKVAPSAGALFARGAEADDGDAVDLSFETSVWNDRDYDGRVYFLRHEGFFDDLHREWDKHDELEKKKVDLKKLADDPETEDVEGGAVLPWHFRDVEDDLDMQELVPDEIVVPDDIDDDEALVIPGPDADDETVERFEYERELREIEKERVRTTRQEKRALSRCCIHIHLPGETCVHGNVMPDSDVMTEVIERDHFGRDIRAGEGEPDRQMRKIEVEVALADTGETVRRKVYEELQYAKKEGFYDDGSGNNAPEVLNLTPETINLVHKGRAVREPTTLGASHVRWRADVTLQGKRGGAGRSAAVLVLRDDLSKLGGGDTHTQTVVHHHTNTNTVVNNTSRVESRSEVSERVRLEVGVGARTTFKPQQTVRDLRQAAADARGLPFDRTVLRYNNRGGGKELINDAATLERKKVFSLDEVSIEEEVEEPRFVYHEIRKQFAFFETCFRVYATSVVIGESVDTSARTSHTQTQLLMSESQWVRMCTQTDVAKKLGTTVHGLGAYKEVFRAAKAGGNLSSQMQLLLEDEAELVGSLAASKLTRLKRRLDNPHHLALDEWITAVTLLAWMTYGFRVPQTWERGVARSLRFFVERVLRVGTLDVQASHDVLMQFASARQAEGGNASGASKEAMVVYRKFAGNSEAEGMTSDRWMACVAWLANENPTGEKYASLVFHTHVGGGKGEPPWIDEGCRFGVVEAIGEDGWDGNANLLKFPRFQVAFSEICFRIQASEGGTPRERQRRAFHNATSRQDISQAGATQGDDDKVMKMYDANHVSSESTTTVIEREIHHHHHYGNRDEPEKPVSDDSDDEKPDYGETWVPPVKNARFKAAARAATAFRKKEAPAIDEAPSVLVSPHSTPTDGSRGDPGEPEDLWAVNDVKDATETARRGVVSQDASAARRRRVVKKQVVVSSTTNVVRTGGVSRNTVASLGTFSNTTCHRTAKQSVVELELAARRKQHLVETTAYASVHKGSRQGSSGSGAGSGPFAAERAPLTSKDFVVDEEDSTDDEAYGGDTGGEEQIGTEAWRTQQEARRDRYRVSTTTSSSLYDVASVRREKIAKEEFEKRLAIETNEKRLAQEKLWAEASSKVDTEASSSGAGVGRRMRRFTEQIEEGWQKDYAGKSTGLTARKWDAV